MEDSVISHYGIGFIIALLRPTVVTMFGNYLIGQQKGLYLLWYPYSLCGIIFFNNVMKRIPSRMLEHQMLTKIGRNSMFFYLFHYSVAISISMLYHRWIKDYNGWECFCYMCLYGFGFMPLFCSSFTKGHLEVSPCPPPNNPPSARSPRSTAR